MSSSRSILREINSQARFEALHKDSECRRIRKMQAEREKLEQDREELRRMQLHSAPRRVPELSWADRQAAAYERRMQALEEKRQQAAESRAREELEPCSFAPKLVASTNSFRQRRVQDAKRHLAILAEEQQDWAHRLQGLRAEEEHVRHAVADQALRAGEPGYSDEALRCVEERRAVVERRCRVGVLQVLHELGRLEAEANIIAVKTIQKGLTSSGQKPEPDVKWVLSDLCPAFDQALLAQVRSEVPDALDFQMHLEVPDAVDVPLVKDSFLRPQSVHH